jgi:predicted branched-subunit amino acid permease
VALFTVAMLVVGYETAMHFSGVAIDGPFQLYDALRRIEAGFRPGVDFQFFHGLGLPYLYYWAYRLLGGELRGSELSRELLTVLSFPAIFLVFFRAFTASWRQALALTAIAIAAAFILRLSAILFAVNGMLGVRAALPTLLPVILFLAPAGRTRIIATGVALGAALFFSTEQGLAACLAYTIVSVVALARRERKRDQAIELALALGIAAATLILCLCAVAGVAGMRGALRYNYKIVPMDQYWFFGSPPNVFVPSWRTVPKLLVTARLIGGALLFGVIAAGVYLRRLWRIPDGDAGRRSFALAVLCVYGLVSCASLLGVFTFAYVQPCWRVLLIVGLLEGTTFATRRDERAGRERLLGVPRAIAVTGLVVVAWCLATTPLIASAVVVSLPHIVGDHFLGGERFGLDGIWPETLREAQVVVDAHRGPKGELPTLWSTYSGWLEARNGMFNPSFDYIIHALGPENRTAYVDKFQATAPTLVQTVRPRYTQYEQWIENNDWAFYDDVLRSYSVEALTPWSILWSRRQMPAPSPQLIGQMTVPAGMTDVQLPPVPAGLSTATTLLEIDLDYDTRNPLSRLPMVGASPRFLVQITGAMSDMPISLDPWVRHTRFPLVVAPGKQPMLHFATFSLLPGASWTARTIKVWVRPIDRGAAPWLRDLVKSYSDTTR